MWTLWWSRHRRLRALSAPTVSFYTMTLCWFPTISGWGYSYHADRPGMHFRYTYSNLIHPSFLKTKNNGFCKYISTDLNAHQTHLFSKTHLFTNVKWSDGDNPDVICWQFTLPTAKNVTFYQQSFISWYVMILVTCSGLKSCDFEKRIERSLPWNNCIEIKLWLCWMNVILAVQCCKDALKGY